MDMFAFGGSFIFVLHKINAEQGCRSNMRQALPLLSLENHPYACESRIDRLYY